MENKTVEMVVNDLLLADNRKKRKKKGWGRSSQETCNISEWGNIGPRLLLMTNRKSHTRFRLVPKSTTLDDLEGPLRTVSKHMRLSELTTKVWMKTDPYYQRRRCNPMTLDSGNIRFMRIFAVVLKIYVNFPEIYVCLCPYRYGMPYSIGSLVDNT